LEDFRIASCHPAKKATKKKGAQDDNLRLARFAFNVKIFMVVERLAENDASAKARYIEWFCVVLTPHCWAGFSQAGCFGGGASRLSKGV